jgi:hypothetical protein
MRVVSIASSITVRSAAAGEQSFASAISSGER